MYHVTNFQPILHFTREWVKLFITWNCGFMVHYPRLSQSQNKVRQCINFPLKIVLIYWFQYKFQCHIYITNLWNKNTAAIYSSSLCLISNLSNHTVPAPVLFHCPVVLVCDGGDYVQDIEGGGWETGCKNLLYCGILLIYSIFTFYNKKNIY